MVLQDVNLGAGSLLHGGAHQIVSELGRVSNSDVHVILPKESSHLTLVGGDASLADTLHGIANADDKHKLGRDTVINLFGGAKEAIVRVVAVDLGPQGGQAATTSAEKLQRGGLASITKQYPVAGAAILAHISQRRTALVLLVERDLLGLARGARPSGSLGASIGGARSTTDPPPSPTAPPVACVAFPTVDFPELAAWPHAKCIHRLAEGTTKKEIDAANLEKTCTMTGRHDTDFKKQLWDMHSKMLTWVYGDVKLPDAPRDPLYWLIAANTDRLLTKCATP